MALSRRQLRAVFAKIGKHKKSSRPGRELKRTGRPDGGRRPSWRDKNKKEKALYTAQWISAMDTLSRPARWLYRSVKHYPKAAAFLAGGSTTGVMTASYGEGSVVNKNSNDPAILQRRERVRKVYRRSRRGKAKRS